MLLKDGKMKRKDLIKLLERNGWWIKREGHDQIIKRRSLK